MGDEDDADNLNEIEDALNQEYQEGYPVRIRIEEVL